MIADLLKNAGPYTLTKTWYVDGTATDVGDVTIGVVDLAGNTIVAAGTATTNGGSGTYTYALANQTQVNYLIVTWTRTDTGAQLVDVLEVVGNRLFSEAQARPAEGNRLSDATKYSDADLAAERIRAADWLESNTGVSWIPRYRRVTLTGNGSDHLSLRNLDRSQGASGGEGIHFEIQDVLSLTIGGTTVDVSKVEAHGSTLWLTEGTFTYRRRPGNVIVELEYGYPTIRNGVDRIALLEIADRLPASRRSRGVVSASDELGTYSWEPQNNGRPSRIPEVNAWLRTHDMRIGIA